jgi:hypothetical protein
LKKQVEKLEREIAASPVFESSAPVTRQELDHLTRLVVIHRFLEQELLRRKRVETQEVPLPVAQLPVQASSAAHSYLF